MLAFLLACTRDPATPSTDGAPTPTGSTDPSPPDPPPPATGTDSGTSGDSTPTGTEPCTIFPADNPWNTRVDTLPVHPDSDAILTSIGLATGLHPDFGTEWRGAPIGIPYVEVGADQPRVPVDFRYRGESDPGPYPIPPDAPIEGGPDADGDRHVIALDLEGCALYELFDARPIDGGSSWRAGSGAIFDLRSNALRPAGWTSADAAGLPIFPGLARYDEIVEEGVLDHALRFTVSESRRAYVPPATHFASSDPDPSLPPMGLRVRLRADVDCGGLSDEVQVICAGLRTYGMLVADNGSDWYVSGAPDPRWDDDALHDLGALTGADFEVVDTGPAVTE